MLETGFADLGEHGTFIVVPKSISDFHQVLAQAAEREGYAGRCEGDSIIVANQSGKVTMTRYACSPAEHPWFSHLDADRMEKIFCDPDSDFYRTYSAIYEVHRHHRTRSRKIAEGEFGYCFFTFLDAVTRWIPRQVYAESKSIN